MNKKKEIKRISSRLFSRSATLLGMTVASGTRFAGVKLANMLSSSESEDHRMQAFFKSQAHTLVKELGALKGSIMKAGQMLSVYGEHFFPPEINAILKTLQADSRPVVWEEMYGVLQEELGDKLKLLELESTPYAAASLGQVYRAKLKSSGEMLALKVQYPGVDRAIDSDLKSLRSILSLSSLIPRESNFDDVFEEIRMMLYNEVDYARELSLIEFYREKLKSDPRFVLPRVYEEFSTKRVLAMSFEDGVSLDGPEVARISQKRRNGLGAAVMELMFREIFQWRTVQTDPHFGNYKVMLSEGGSLDKIVLLDFGAVRIFPETYITSFAQMVYASLVWDPQKIVRAATQLGFLRADDSYEMRELMTKICGVAIEGFSPEYESPSRDGSDEGNNPYRWGESDLPKRLAELAKNAVFTFRLRPPPREAVFLDRKMVGTFTIIARLGLRLGPRKLLLSYLKKAA